MTTGRLARGLLHLCRRDRRREGDLDKAVATGMERGRQILVR